MIDGVNQKWAEFEELGETEVRQMLMSNIWNSHKTILAKGWLDYCDRASKRAFKDEEIAIARAASASAASAAASASDSALSARISAKAAINQAITARLALIIASTSLIIGIISIFISIYQLLPAK